MKYATKKVYSMSDTETKIFIFSFFFFPCEEEELSIPSSIFAPLKQPLSGRTVSHCVAEAIVICKKRCLLRYHDRPYNMWKETKGAKYIWI